MGLMPIRSFKAKETAAIFRGLEVKKLPREIQPLARIKLNLIDAAKCAEDLRVPPGNMLEKLSGKRKGQWSIRINRQWRICFEFDDAIGEAFHVEICDYH
jgi:toxin HigB-1